MWGSRIKAMNKQQSAAKSTVRQNKSGQNKKENKNNMQVIHAPTAASVKYTNVKPEVMPEPKGSVRVRHREYISDINSVGLAFQTISYPINPGLASFPWLSQLANLYESYVFKSLHFEYEPATATTTTGTVILSIDFDAADAPPANKQDAMANQNAVRSAPWTGVKYNASAKDLKKFGIQRYVRSGNLSPNLDIKTYDVGTLHLCTQGQSTVQAVGELYVSYDIVLYTPQGNSSYISNNSAKVVSITGVGLNNLIGTDPVITGGLPIRRRDSNSLWIDKPGEYLLDLIVSGTGIETGGDAVVIAVNGTGNVISKLAPPSSIFQYESNPSEAYVQYAVKISSLTSYISFTTAQITTVVGTNLRISAYQYALA